MGIGLGIVIASLLLLPYYQRPLSPGDIETQARKMGMIYPDDIKALPQKDKGGER